MSPRTYFLTLLVGLLSTTVVFVWASDLYTAKLLAGHHPLHHGPRPAAPSLVAPHTPKVVADCDTSGLQAASMI